MLLQVFLSISLTTRLIVAVLSQDVSEHAEATRLLSHQAGHDHLTGQPNRKLLVGRLRTALEHSAASCRAVGVLFLDLDDFKRVNDELGHAIGDHVLVGRPSTRRGQPAAPPSRVRECTAQVHQRTHVQPRTTLELRPR